MNQHATYLDTYQASRRLTGIAAAVLVHVVLIYALVTGSALKVVEVMREPFQTLIIAEPKPVAAPAEQPPAPAPPRSAPARPARAAPAPVVPAVPAPEVAVPPAPAEGAITVAPLPAPAAPPPVDAVGSSRPGAAAEGPKASVQLEGCAMPEYPAASVAAEETGTVALSFLVGVEGQVLESRIDRSSGHRRLDEAARRALGRCKFRPAIVDGKPRQAWAHINYVWRLE